MVLETPISKDKKYHLLMLERASNYLVHHFAFNTLLGRETGCSFEVTKLCRVPYFLVR